MKIARRQNWPSLLAEFLREHENVKFSWGQKDCGLFAADWIFLCTGVDFAEKYRGKYTSAQGAAKVFARQGLRDVSEALTAELGAPLKNALMGQRGDIALMPQDGGERCAGIITGSRVALLHLTAGIVYQPLKNSLMVWKV